MEEEYQGVPFKNRKPMKGEDPNLLRLKGTRDRGMEEGEEERGPTKTGHEFNDLVNELDLSQEEGPEEGGDVEMASAEGEETPEEIDAADIPEEEKEENKRMGEHLQRYGRHGDSILAHISAEEAEMLKQMGGKGDINPNTGLPEFFWSFLIPALAGLAGMFMNKRLTDRSNRQMRRHREQEQRIIDENNRATREWNEKQSQWEKSEKKKAKKHNKKAEEGMMEMTANIAAPSPDKHLYEYGGRKRYKSFADGGCVQRRGQYDYARGGPVKGKGNGRADDIKATLPQGGYVVNAHDVADIGGGNTNHGEEVLNRTLKKLPKEEGRAPTMKAYISSGEYVIPPQKARDLMAKAGNPDIGGFLKELSKYMEK